VLTISGLDFCIDFDTAVGWNHVLGDGNTFVDGYALFDYRVVLHATFWLAFSSKKESWKTTMLCRQDEV
jgi:hypothetical protein